MAVVRTAGGRFDPKEDRTFFLAGATSLAIGGTDFGATYPHVLAPLENIEIHDTARGELINGWLDDERVKLFIDSGIFALTNAHAREHGVTMDEALALPPDKIDGFDALLTKYLDVCKKLGPRIWGYTELDQGGADCKRVTRAMLEGEGLRPIPIYHPLNDGWDYFDELLDGYDRIAVGNVVWASKALRADILLAVWERVRRCKHRVWIHVLGHTPNPTMVALPFNSMDSTEPLYALQYGSKQNHGRAMTGMFSTISDPAFSADRSAEGEDKLLRGDGKGADLCVYIAHTDLRCWRRAADDLALELGEAVPMYPKLVKGEARDVKRATKAG